MTGRTTLIANVVAAQACAETHALEGLPIASGEERRLVTVRVEPRDRCRTLTAGIDARVGFADRGTIDVTASPHRGIRPLVRDLQHATGAFGLEMTEERAAEAGRQQEGSREVRGAVGGVDGSPNGQRSGAVVAERHAAAFRLLMVESKGGVRAAAISGHFRCSERPRLLPILRRE